MSNNEELVELKTLLHSKWWELLVNVMKKRRAKLAYHILYDKYMNTPDKDLTQADLNSAEIRCINRVIDQLPKVLVKNPNYDPETLTPEEEDEQEQAELLEDVFNPEMVTPDLFKQEA